MAKAEKPKGKSNKEKAAEAFDLYLHTDLTQKRICDIIGWSERTFTTYKEKEGWEDVKDAETISPKRIIANLYKRAHELSEAQTDEKGKPIDVDADKLVKIANTIEKLSDKKVTLSHYINVFKDFTTYVLGSDRELAIRINELQQQFIKEKAQQ